MPQLGTEDRAALRRLERAGKLTYVDDDFRERTRRWNGAGLFAARVPANAEMVKAIIPITRSKSHRLARAHIRWQPRRSWLIGRLHRSESWGSKKAPPHGRGQALVKCSSSLRPRAT